MTFFARGALPPDRLAGLGSIAASYRLILCDVFGVLHDAERVHPAALRALVRARREGLVVVLVSNSASPGTVLRRSLEARGVGPEVCDAVVTSADVTRAMLGACMARRVCHIGPAREAVLFDGLEIDLVRVEDAEIVVCTGFEEPADDHARTALLATARARGLTLICTNPDHTAGTAAGALRFAGLIAAAYEGLAGAVVLTGKPDRSIYAAALAASEGLCGGSIEADRVLAIGDTYSLDIKGALGSGFDALWVAREGEADVVVSSERPRVMRTDALAW